jgi:glycosyltransferase involved in cell wall biosynthesis
VNKQRLAAFVITYLRPQRLVATLRSIVAQSEPPQRILIIDNGEAAATNRALAQTGLLPVVEHHVMGQNLGPAGGAAYALAELLASEYEWIYWGDDDNPPESGDLFARLLALTDGEQGVVGGIGQRGFLFDWRRGEIVRYQDEELAGAVDVDLIAGGDQLLLRRRAVAASGLPDARLFWGWEDFGYCLELRRRGFRLLADGEGMLARRRRDGRLGRTWRRPLVPGMSLEEIGRFYYSTRNYLVLMRERLARPDLARREVCKVLLFCVTAWRRGPRFAYAFIASQLPAIVDAYRGRLGQTRPLPRNRAW